QTNNQVAAVDEADIIKTDGDYIYTISNGNVYIIKAYPGADAQVVATLKYEDSDPQSLFIQGKHLAVFGNYYSASFFKETDFRPTSGLAFFNIYDLSEPSAPKLVKEYKFEGSYFNARMKGDFAYFVVRSAPEERPIPMPIIFEGNAKMSVPVGDVYYYDVPYRNPQFVTVHAIDLAAPDAQISSKTIAVEYSQNLYMSESNIYITYTEWVDEWELRQEISNSFLKDRISDTDRAVIEKIKAADNDILSQYEKQQKISNIYNSYFYLLPQKEQEELNDRIEELVEAKLKELGYLEYTVINKIAVDNGEITVEGNGKVPGSIINQFSMDEDGDNFRIATTLSQRWSRFAKQQTESTNNVYALDKDMKIIGMLEGLAPGEQIYSTRFIGSRLYMVTFRQVDPFFVIDLSNPNELKELGKLKLPGFSRYLHPYDADTIIGIGQESTEQGRVTGLKISLFDVSDVANPKEAAKFVTEETYAQSTALWEHKAFLFDKEKELLVIPAYSNEFYSQVGGKQKQQGYNGAFVFSITPDSIKLRGLIDHSRNQTGQEGYYYQPMVERSLWINELLYTKSPSLLRINKIEDLSSVKNVQLQGTPANFPVY
ncbi:MAG TPA: beta-propeller domain-containing protein, partial [Candidatus Nanoarchaeia archaeon]|nr:beta-propeller domain-containing protein [Candidatus Nanoarchaeia archaeon]